MSKGVLSDVEAKLLLKKLNRRMSAISVLTRGRLTITWYTGLLVLLIWILIGAGWMWWEDVSDARKGYLLLMVITVLLGIVETYNANLNKRVDALVELLQQEGILHPELRPDSAKKP
jgi:hypothetical protein